MRPIKQEGPHLDDILKQCNKLLVLIFEAVQVDMLESIKPTSLVLQSISILLPDAVNALEVTLNRIRNLSEKFANDGEATLLIFLSLIMKKMAYYYQGLF